MTVIGEFLCAKRIGIAAGPEPRASKRLREPRVLENAIGRVARDDLSVYRERRVRDRAVPDLVITLPLPDEIASSLAENAPDFAGKVRHDLRDHQLGLLEGTQLLPVDNDRHVARCAAESRLEYIRHDHLETLDQSLA